MKKLSFFFLGLVVLSGCRVYKQDILFTTEEYEQTKNFAFGNYTIQVNDWLSLFLYTNSGEQIIDPNWQPIVPTQNQQFLQNRVKHQFLVQQDGRAKLPQAGMVPLAGKTINEAESILEEIYNNIYKDSFVKIEFENKRVTVLGQNKSAVVPIINENMTVVEVLALAGGIRFGEKAQNIRLLRGDLSNPQVFLIDLSTIEGMKNSQLMIQPGDILYIEPWRRPWQETLRDISPIIGLITSVSTLVFLLTNAF